MAFDGAVDFSGCSVFCGSKLLSQVDPWVKKKVPLCIVVLLCASPVMASLVLILILDASWLVLVYIRSGCDPACGHVVIPFVAMLCIIPKISLSCGACITAT